VSLSVPTRGPGWVHISPPKKLSASISVGDERVMVCQPEDDGVVLKGVIRSAPGKPSVLFHTWTSKPAR